MAPKRSRDRGGSSGVSRRAVLGVLLAGGLGAAGVQGTGAFSSVAGDRSFSVGTASDGNALLGVDTKDPEGDSGESVTLMTLTNRFTDPLTLERVSVVSSGQLSIGRNDLDVSTWSLQPGESAEIDAALSCSSGATDEVELEIRGSTSEESVELVRSTTVSCSAASGACSGPRDVFDQAVDGDIESEKTVVISSGVKVAGDVDAADCVVLEEKAEIDGSATAGATVSLGSEATVKGDTDANRDVSLDAKASIKGDVGAGGSVSTENKAEIDGAVDAGGSVSLGSEASVKGDVDAGGDVPLGAEAAIEGDVGAGGDVSLGSKAEIDGAVDADGDVSLDSKAVVKGDVDAGGSVSVGQGASIKGDVSEGG